MIFYFTGTGNSLYAAKQLDSDCRSIPRLLRSGRPRWTFPPGGSALRRPFTAMNCPAWSRIF